MIGLNAMALFGSLVFLPLFFQLVLGASASKAGLMLAPMMGGVIVASVTGGRLVSRFGRYKIFPIIGLIMGTGSFLTLAWCAFADGPTGVIETALVCLGGGLGFVMPNLTVAIQNSVERTDMGAATSISAFIRSLGGALGVAVAGDGGGGSPAAIAPCRLDGTDGVGQQLARAGRAADRHDGARAT